MSDLINKLPYFYNNKITRPIIEAEQIERDILIEELKDILNQCFVSTATWGLDYWEEMLYIPTIKSKSYEERRSLIYIKLRDIGTTTVEFVKHLAMSFFGTENVEVVEDNSNYVFSIGLVNTKFEKIELKDLYNILEIYKPAHLNYYFTFSNTDKVIINSQKKSGLCEFPICNVTKVGTWWCNYVDLSVLEGEVIQGKSYVGFSELPICGQYKSKV